MLALDRLVPPRLDLPVDLLVQIGHRAGAYPRAPQRLGDVLDPADRHPGQVHLDQGLLHRALPPAIALDDRRLERLLPQLRHLQRHLAGLRLQLALVAPGPHVPSGLSPLVAPGVAEPIGLRLQHRVQRLLDRAPDNLVQMLLTRSSSIRITLLSGLGIVCHGAYLCERSVRHRGQTPAASATASGVCPLSTCRTIRSRPRGVSRAFLCMFIWFSLEI